MSEQENNIKQTSKSDKASDIWNDSPKAEPRNTRKEADDSEDEVNSEHHSSEDEDEIHSLDD